MTDDVLALFSGLTPEQAQQMRKQMMPALWKLRRSITGKRPTATVRAAAGPAGAPTKRQRPRAARASEAAIEAHPSELCNKIPAVSVLQGNAQSQPEGLVTTNNSTPSAALDDDTVQVEQRQDGAL